MGLLWGEYPEAGRLKWRRYFGFLVFIPFLSLLNKDRKHRLPWAIVGLLGGYIIVLFTGIYQWTIVGVQGIPPLRISYLVFSSMLGIGIILSLYLAGTTSQKSEMDLMAGKPGFIADPIWSAWSRSYARHASCRYSVDFPEL